MPQTTLQKRMIQSKVAYVLVILTFAIERRMLNKLFSGENFLNCSTPVI